MTCIVSGSLVSITNDPLINTEIYIQSTDGIRALGSRIILPKVTKYISDDTGSVVMELEPGSYRMIWIQNTKVNTIPVSVPDRPTALLSDLLNEVEYPDGGGTAMLQIELRNNGGDIEWRYEGDPWSLLISNDELSVPSDMTVEVSIGNVTEGESASVTNTGTNRNVVLDFVLPEGAIGEKGEDGEQGPQGIQGVPGEPGRDGIDGKDGIDGEDGKSFTVDAIGNTNDRSLYDSEDIGFSFLDIDEGELFFRVDPTGWSVAIPFGKGEKGEDGEDGEQGLQGVQGPQGIQGVKGDDGSIIHYGNGVPSSGLGEINDWYIRDNASRTLYQKTGASVWTGRGDLVGPQGQQGQQGDQGIQGLPGEDGDDGPQGPQGPDGQSAYEVAIFHGFSGTETEWLDSLKGESAYEIAVRNGFVGSEQDWLNSLSSGVNPITALGGEGQITITGGW